uniref:Uncharacterized protein n=1 Tax=Aegilops tauschii subsp. strangulata TaxID=200361 RepID=A0A453HNN1_AEGTS
MTKGFQVGLAVAVVLITRSNLTRYRDRGGDLSLDRSLHQDRTLTKIPYKKSTPSASSISRAVGIFQAILQ